MNHILVIGSLNADLETDVDRFPQPGETLLGGPLHVSCGGKGNNQAVAAAKLGAKVTMLGALGQDNFGDMLFKNLQAHHINTDHVLIRKNKPSATALITRSQNENHIIVTDGANNTITPQDIIHATSLIEKNDIILLQQEIPLDAQIKAIEIAHNLNKIIVLNPAPMRPLPKEVTDKISYLLPNEHEIIALGNDKFNTPEDIIMNSSPPIIMTWGSKGVLFKNKNQQLEHLPAYSVKVVDSTGAGDTFCGAFCCFLHLGVEGAIKKALQASALSVTRSGAQGGMPTLQELESSDLF
ncbi:ribokinase [Commensalibacter papalotli (ex Servin-Garciduenas et al. 2014)]|uniref:Ribokinase n=1 Tax=Commensalibacter papalotli (ex Servin-Garciduenas et al. 2014) TaxID=1208583 RepID=W7DJF1_9PROT|nr:ribokinase [Commensalibacter papalotli (ex Servin-Garciduenas et al. 2014)]EUK17477.1 ribokinase [Commensalibacter papalotli (ex Servin-Garciduenas et al. 2014)]